MLSRAKAGSTRLALASAACLVSSSCDAPRPVDPAENQSADMVGKSVGRPVPQEEGRRLVKDRAAESADKKRPMPEPTTKPAVPQTPRSPPRREIKPSPWQPPAEVDPVHPDPGDEVPR